MHIISEILSIQSKLKQRFIKWGGLKSAELLNEYIQQPAFKTYFSKFEKSKWKPDLFAQIIKEMPAAQKIDSYTENTELVRMLKLIYAEKFFNK